MNALKATPVIHVAWMLIATTAGCAGLNNRWTLPQQRPVGEYAGAPAGASLPPVVAGQPDELTIEIPDDIPEFEGPDAEADSDGAASPSTPYRTTIRGQNLNLR